METGSEHDTWSVKGRFNIATWLLGKVRDGLTGKRRCLRCHKWMEFLIGDWLEFGDTIFEIETKPQKLPRRRIIIPD